MYLIMGGGRGGGGGGGTGGIRVSKGKGCTTREYPLAEGRVIEFWVTYRLSDVMGWDDTCGG